jgi:uncharacterized protein
MRTNMKYVLITGATSGIGLELAKQYVKLGANLLLVARRLSLLEALKREYESAYNVHVEVFACDLSHLDDLEKLMKEINASYELSAVIHNAGIGIFSSIDAVSKESIMSQQMVNVAAPILTTKHCIENVRRNKGSLIYVASILSYWGSKKGSVYVSTKHAILGYANSVRLEYPGLHVMTVHPSTVKTNFFGDSNAYQKKVLTPELVARKIIKAQQKRKRILNIPQSICFIRLIHLFFPALVDKINVKFYTNK